MIIKWPRPLSLKKTIFVVATISLVSFAQETFAQIAHDKFIDQTQDHRKRVYRNSVFLFKALNGETRVPTEIALGYFALHDQPKVMSRDQLRAGGYNREQSIGERLATFYGLGRNMPPAQFAELKATINELNSTEDVIKEKYFLENNLNSAQISFLKTCELASDSADTGEMRSKEFGSNLLSGAVFLRESGKNYEAELAEKLIAEFYQPSKCISLVSQEDRPQTTPLSNPRY